MICPHCGEEVLGLVAIASHPCTTQATLEPMGDNEIRNNFMEMGMPNMAFEALGMAPPTEMERAIFEKPMEPPQPYQVIMSSTTYEAFEKLFKDMATEKITKQNDLIAKWIGSEGCGYPYHSSIDRIMAVIEKIAEDVKYTVQIDMDCNGNNVIIRHGPKTIVNVTNGENGEDLVSVLHAAAVEFIEWETFKA